MTPNETAAAGALGATAPRPQRVSGKAFKQGIARQFDRGASTYDRYADVQNLMADRLMARLRCRPEPFDRVLEVGCGTGFLTAKLLEAFPEARITAVDLSAGMVNAAGRRLASEDRVELMVADAEAWHWEPGRFDLVVSNATAQWFERPEATMARLARSLHPGGFMLHSVFGPRTFVELDEILDRIEGQRSRGLALLPAERWTAMLRSAGLCEVGSEETLEHRRYPDLLEFLEAVKRTGAGYARPASPDPWNGYRTLRQVIGRRQHSERSPYLTITYELVELWGVRRASHPTGV